VGPEPSIRNVAGDNLSESWHEYFFNICRAVAAKSKDRSSKVGAVIVGPDNEIRSTGFNGFPRGIDDSIDSRHKRPSKYLWTEHSERNAVYQAARAGTSTNNCRIYVEWYPCADCSRAIIQAGIKEVVIDGKSHLFNDAELNERWKDSIAVTKEMLAEAGVIITVVH